MKTYLVRDVSGDNARIIEADSFSIVDGNRIQFYDEDSNLLAVLLNVTVEPCSAERRSSKELVKLAQKYIDFDLLDRMSGPWSPEEVNKVSAEYQQPRRQRSLSQASKD